MSILVHYIGWNLVYDEIINTNSQRLAAHEFYSSRMDIPRYHLNQEIEDNMHSYVVIGEPYHPNGNPENIEHLGVEELRFDLPDLILENQ